MQMQATTFKTPQQQVPVAQDLNDLTMPSFDAAQEVQSSASTLGLQDISTAQAPQLRDIALSTSQEELAFYKFQVDRQQSTFNSQEIEAYAPGSLPSPQVLLQAVA